MILEITCNDAALANVLNVVKNFFNVLYIVVPILLMISLTILFTKAMTNPEEKKLLSKIKNSVLAAAIIFFIPVLINVVMGILGESTNISSCWKNASKITSNATYIDDDDTNKKTSPIINSSEYKTSSD